MAASNLSHCHHCGKKLRDTSFCHECGHAFCSPDCLSHHRAQEHDDDRKGTGPAHPPKQDDTGKGERAS